MKHPFTVIAMILAVGMVCSASFLSKLYLRIRNEEAISVKGVAELQLTSDIGKLCFSVIETGSDLGSSLANVRSNYATILAELKKQFGDQVRFIVQEPRSSPIQQLTVHPDGKKTYELSHYQAENSCQIVTTNVQVIAEINRMLTVYSIKKMHIEAGSPEYLLRDISQIKLQLLQQATANGWERAKALVAGKGSLGKLVSASQGVFQITEPYSTESSWSGAYDKSTIEKNIKAVVTLEYAVE
jgi:hypothetical protein